ncbi:MAG TPA: hypothetical protein VIQ62_02425 [Burkholderiales bacterium]
MRQILLPLLIALIAGALYYPFLRNPPLFDDRTFFWGGHFYYYATHPLGLALRLPGYFSLAVTEILLGGMFAHRTVSLVAHVACCTALYFVLVAVLRLAQDASGTSDRQSITIIAFIGAALFAIHPVAVYGAGYLVQRTIVFATLFSLLSILFFLRGLAERRYAGAVCAAICYSLAVLSKEHAISVCIAVLACIPLTTAGRAYAQKYALLYAALCAPAALFVVLLSKSVIGRAYEPDLASIASQMEHVFGRAADLTWSFSALVQAGLFFKYLGLWILPDPGGMSIDVRIDFLSAGTALRTAGALAFVGFGLLALRCLLRRGRWRVAGYGLLYVWIVFLVEFAAARFQEPFVLYRSYLWAPGLVIAMAAVLIRWPRAVSVAFFVVTCPILLYQAHDRLTTFSNPLLVWEDAVQKLPDHAVPWGSRTLYNLGREYLYAEQPEKAIAVTERCLATYPETFHCYFARGAVHLQLGEFERALPYLVHAMGLEPRNGVAAHRVGLALEGIGELNKARAMYERSSALGYKGAWHSIARLDSPGADPLAPGKPVAPKSVVVR